MSKKLYLVIFCLPLLMFIDPLSIISMFLILILGLFIKSFLFKRPNYSEYIFIFSLNTIIAVFLYWTNILAFPNNFGCTGAQYGGTDDLFFFQEAINNGISYRGDRSFFMHPFSIFLQKFHFLISFFKTTNLIDLIFINIFISSYIPFFCKKISYYFTKNYKVSRLAYIISICSPFLIQHNLVLVRDGITASLFIGIFYFYLNKRYFLLIVFFILLSYLRILSGALSIFFILSYIYFMEKKSNLLKYGLIFSAIIIMFLPTIIDNVDKSGVLEEGIFRQGYFEVIKDNSSSTSGAVYILSLPYYLRIPLGTAYFIGTPFLNLKDIFSGNLIYFWPKISLFYSLFFVFYFTYLIRAIFSNKLPILRFLVFIFIFYSLLFSQISLELRHKTLIMPLLFIIVAISYYLKPSRLIQQLSFIGAFTIFLLQLIFNFISLIN